MYISDRSFWYVLRSLASTPLPNKKFYSAIDRHSGCGNL